MRLTDFFLVLPTFVLAIVLAPIILDIVGTDAELFGIRATPVRDRRGDRHHELGVDGADHPLPDALASGSGCSSTGPGSIGGGRAHIMRRHILPNVINLIVANTVLTFAAAIFTETTLAFIGLGDPFSPSWGQILNAAQESGAPGPRGVVVHRPAGLLRGPRDPRLHARGQRARRRPQPEGGDPPMSICPIRRASPAPASRAASRRPRPAQAAAPTPSAARRPGSTRPCPRSDPGRRQWPLPEAGRPRRAAPRGRGAHDPLPARRRRSSTRSTTSRFTLDDGEALGIAGESGCGKTTTALSLLRLLPSNAEVVARQRAAVRDRPPDARPRSRSGATAGARSRSSSRGR